MSRGRPSRFQIQLAPCLLNLRYLLSISRMVSSAGTSRMVQWSLIMLMMRILRAFLVSLPMMFLESFHHLTSLSESTCRQLPPGQQNSRWPVCRFTFTLGSLLLLSNQQVMSVPADCRRGVVSGLAIFSWRMRVRLQTSPNSTTQQSLAVLWVLTSSKVQQRCLASWTGRNCLRLSLLGTLIKLYKYYRLQIQSNMKINLPSKFIPNFLSHHQEEFDDYHCKPITSPFRPIENVLRANLEKNDRNNRISKTFLDNQSDEEDNDINIEEQAVDEVKIGSNCEREEQTLPVGNSAVQSIRQSNQLKVEQFVDIAYQDSKYTPINHDSTNEEITLPAFRITPKLQNDDWSSSSDSHEHPEHKVAAENKTNGSMLVERPIMLQLSKQKLFEEITNGAMRCLLRRDKKSPSGFIEYNLYLQGSLQHIMTVRKEGVWQYCLYLRQSASDGFFSYSKAATLESNFLGNKYTLIKHKEKHSSATICYETNLLGLSGPRKFFTYLPKTQVPYEYLNEAYQSQKWKKHIEKCVSRTAKWNQKVQSYVLNFQGRASQSSIKNFVVTDKGEQEENNFIIFGKAAPDVYNLDIQAPFSLIQGLAVALTSFERKLTCD